MENYQNKLKKILEFKTENERDKFKEECFEMTLISFILKIMKYRNISKDELAKKMKTSKGYLTQIFSGDKPLTIKTLYRIKNVLNFKIELKITR